MFSAAGAGVKTNLLFFTKGKPTEKIWYYDLSDVKVGRRTPLTLKNFDDFSRPLPKRADSERSWTVDFVATQAAGRRGSRAVQEAGPGQAAGSEPLEGATEGAEEGQDRPRQSEAGRSRAADQRN